MGGLRSLSDETTLAMDYPSMPWHDEFHSEFDSERWLSSYEDSEAALLSLSVLQRIGGALSLVGGLYIFARAWTRKHCAFDRIMLGLSIHTMLWGVYHLWGTAAIPVGTPGVAGAQGTIFTCSLQGFLLQISMVVPFYYVFLSLYSWVVVLHGNFDPAKYEWIEKYIHVGVHLFPIGSAIYLWSIDSFNSNGLHCWIASVPSGCGDATGIECTRGPQNPQYVLWAFGGVPALFFLLFPTIVMVTLTYSVYQKQQQANQNQEVVVIPSEIIAKQSAIYIGSLYWVYLPIFVYYGFNFFSHDKSYGIAVWANLITNSMGLWFAIVYWYFSTEEVHDSGCDDDEDDTKEGSSNPTTEDNSKPDKSDDSFTLTKLESSNNRSRWGSSNATSMTSSSNTNARLSRGASRRISRASKRFSFNIFDGTASSGMFSAFIFEGDSEDEEKDAAESRHWNNCQQMNNDE